MEEDQKANGGYFDTREKGLAPPLVTTKFITRDFGNASPRFIRSTMYYVPATDDMRKQSGVPFGVVISPLGKKRIKKIMIAYKLIIHILMIHFSNIAKLGADEIEPPVTDFGPSGPVRCMRCKAYMCSLMQFIDGGRRFQCPFCKGKEETCLKKI